MGPSTYKPAFASSATCILTSGTVCPFLSTGVRGEPMCWLFKEKLCADDQRHDGKPYRCEECVRRS